MAIQEEIVVELATVEVNDDFRVELVQLRKTLDYTPDQAERLGLELVDAAVAARRLLAEHLVTARARDVQPVTVTGEVVL